ncbi:MAG: primosomal protein N' [Lachnospiraceae bacterium]|nr:primosomal protein N' [Lachnospiraceae bacterium]
MQYADVIVDISTTALDRTFQYRIPDELEGTVTVGSPVLIPFGSSDKLRKGYIVGIGDELKFPVERIKNIVGPAEKDLSIEDTMMGIAYWMREQYGGTLYDALRTVLPVRKKVQKQPKRIIRRKVSEEDIRKAYQEATAKKHKAKARLLEPLCTQDFIPYEIASGKMNVAKATIDFYVGAGLLEVAVTAGDYYPGDGLKVGLNEEQQKAAEAVITRRGEGRPFLLFGITGSGKTEVYIRIIEQVLSEGKQAIVLIPEIALTYQTLLRFYRCFGDRVGYVHSKMALSDRYLQCEKAKNGEISVMIGPRSALFTPFQNLGLIVIDEEQELSYHSETTPKYYSDEVAIKRTRDCGAALVLGSATPSVKSFRRAESGAYILLELTKRAKEGAQLPTAEIVDMREELTSGNRSVFSRSLRQAITECLSKKQQAMLFLNRRGFSGFLSCRSCGEVVKCPHCDVSMTVHRSGNLQCHYCGHTAPMPKQCPACGSKYIAAFGTGTQKIEELVKKEFPDARVMRMDADTTKGKDGYETILGAFAEGKADILVGTQMIVKGHDFGNVTLVGVLAADLSLGVSEYSAAERTFHLLAQAAGRAGRDRFPGKVVIQTYRPDHYALTAAAAQDYRLFYEQEIRYRKLAQYPPCASMLRVLGLGKDEAALNEAMKTLAEIVRTKGVTVLGPAADGMRYAMDIFRVILYIKAGSKDALIAVRDRLEREVPEGITLQFEFSE